MTRPEPPATADRLRSMAAARLEECKQTGRLIVVAVSGGGDSIALARLLHDLGLTFVIAHLDHGVRAEAAAEDARFVANLAASLSAPFVLGSWKPKRPNHFEADARRARYAWLLDVANAQGAAAVAVGHNRDDQAETVLHRILRGTGPDGLAGMATARPLGDGVALIRPLLDATRQDLRAYLRSIDQPWREDATNQDEDRTRARIRQDLIPKLAADYNPRVVDALANLAELAAAERQARDAALATLEPAVLRTLQPGFACLDRAKLAGLDAALRIALLRRIWRRLGWPERHMSANRWRRLSSASTADPSRLDIGEDVRIEVVRDEVRLIRGHALCWYPVGDRAPETSDR